MGNAGTANGFLIDEAVAGGRPGARTEAGAVNRRRSHRYTAVKDHLWMGWWSGDEFVLVEANLVNISEGGVLVSVSPSPPQGTPVWMRLEGSSVKESLPAVVLDSKWMALKRRFGARLAFRHACPADFYETAVYGRSTGSQAAGLA